MLYLINEVSVTDNVYDINDMRRVKNIQKGILLFEQQLSDLKKATALLAKHAEYRFFSIACHELVGKQKEVAQELLKLRVRLDRYKASINKESIDE